MSVRHLGFGAGLALLAAGAAPAAFGQGEVTDRNNFRPGNTPRGAQGIYANRGNSTRLGGGFGGFGGGYHGGFGYGPYYGGYGGFGGYGVGLTPFGGYGGFRPTYGVGPYWGPYGATYPTQLGAAVGYAGFGYGPVVTAPGAAAVGVGPYGYGGAGYGGATYGPSYPVGVGVGAGPVVGGVNPTGAVIGGNFGPNPAIAEGLRDEADRWRGPVDLGDAGPLPAAERPPTERELAEALREERRGDEAFAALDYREAIRRYRAAAEAAPTRGETLYRLGFARLAVGDFAEAGDNLRRAVELNPSLPNAGPTLDDLLGGGNRLAKTSLLSAVAELARADVRDPDRLFLLAAAMHASGDSRAREIFEAAWRLTGGRPWLRAYLDPVDVDFTPAASEEDLPVLPEPTDDADDEAEDDVVGVVVGDEA